MLPEFNSTSRNSCLKILLNSAYSGTSKLTGYIFKQGIASTNSLVKDLGHLFAIFVLSSVNVNLQANDK